MRVLEWPPYLYRGGCGDKIKYFLPVFYHSFVPKETVQGCSTLGLSGDFPAVERCLAEK